jgi:NADPH-dependent glutamate synthase beta subunit-like oxidoreductase
MMSHAIPGFRLPDDVVRRELEGITLPNMIFKFGKSLGKDLWIDDLRSAYDAVFLAPGLWKGRELDIRGLNGESCMNGLGFLMDFHDGGKIEIKENVLIIGGGSVAADTALAVKESGSRRVILVCLEERQEMPCLPSEVTALEARGIEIKNGWSPKEVEAPGKLLFIACSSVYDRQGSFRPTFDESMRMTQEFDQIITAVGQTTDPALADYLKEVFGQTGPIVVDEATMEVPSHAGVFAGGDIVRGAGTIVQAVADGRRAAAAMDARMNNP